MKHMRHWPMLAAVSTAVFILSGCASSHMLGQQALARGDLQAAERQLTMAAREGDGAAWNDLGVVYGKQGRSREAFDAYTMGARYGDPTARGNLLRMGWPVPIADLAPQQVDDGSGGNLGAVLRGAAEGYGSGPQPVTIEPKVTRSSTCTARPTAVAPGTQGPLIVTCR